MVAGWRGGGSTQGECWEFYGSKWKAVSRKKQTKTKKGKKTNQIKQKKGKKGKIGKNRKKNLT